VANDCSERVCPYGISHTTTPQGDLNMDGDRYDNTGKAIVYKTGPYAGDHIQMFQVMNLSKVMRYKSEVGTQQLQDSSSILSLFPLSMQMVRLHWTKIAQLQVAFMVVFSKLWRPLLLHKVLGKLGLVTL
jgi:hypothetical protein